MNPIRILDGGMGQALIRRSSRELTPMWSADIMLNEPDLVRDLHLEFIQSGASIITLNTYTATPQRLKRDSSISLLKPLHQAAMLAATQAIALAGNNNISIAGCLPPLVASYHAEVSPDFNECLDTYRTLVSEQSPASDIFICETMSSITEAKAACIAAKESNKEVWLAFSVSDEKPQELRGGESLALALAVIADYQPDAVLLNCSKPEAISQSLAVLLTSASQVGVYANGFTSVKGLYPGTTVKTLTARKDLSPKQYANYALKWANEGASIIGGCCEISPAHIQSLCNKLQTAGFKLT